MSRIRVNELEPFTPLAGIGVGAPNTMPSALLNLQSTTQGFSFPRMTQAQRDAIAVPFSGLTIFNLDTLAVETYNGTSWETGGIKSINGLSAKIQFLTNGTAGVSPNWTQTGGNTNVLNIPQASTVSVLSGLISKADYDTFNIRQFPTKNVVYVNQNAMLGPQDFNSIAAAVASITTASATNQFVVKVGPGVYVEPQIVMKPFVSIHGDEMQSVIITPSNPADHLILGASACTIRYCTIKGVTGTNKAGIYLNQDGGFQVRNCVIRDNSINIFIEAITLVASLTADDCIITGSFSKGLWVKNSGNVASVVFKNSIINSLGASGSSAVFVEGSGVSVGLFSLIAQGISSADCMVVQNGATLKMVGGEVKGYNNGVTALNVGSAPKLDILGINLDSNTSDFQIQHPGTNGSVNGIGTNTTSFFDIGTISSLAIALFDPTDGNIVTSGAVVARQKDNTFVDTTTLVTESSTMGTMEGGELTAGTGLVLNVADGFGYLEVEPEILKRFDWASTTITLPANQSNYVYFDNTGTLVINPSFPDTHLVILLGRAVTNATAIDFVDATLVDAEHSSNHFDELFRDGTGAIYSTGSIVSEFGTRGLNVSTGKFFVSTVKYLPVGGTNITWRSYYRDGSGGQNRVTQSQVDNAFYDDGSGTLAAIPASNYAKHSLYVVGEGVNEQYLLVYGQQFFTALTLAEQGNISVPPSYFNEGVVLIASIIVQEGFANIKEIRDERPVIGFKASGVAAASVHGNLLGLLADDHPQYIRADGARAFTGSQSLGGNALTSVSNVNGVVVETHEARHLPNGADPLVTAAPLLNIDASTANGVGTANSLSRSDHQHAVSTGVVSQQIPDQSNFAGTSINLTRADHIHNIPTAAPIANLSATTVNGQGIASTFSRSDHSHAISTGVVSTQIPDQTNNGGSSASLARADHIHNIPTAVVVSIGTANLQGSATSFSRSDHVHNHGAQSDPTLHSVVTTIANGFMSSTDKTKLDGIASGATNTTLSSTAPANVDKSAAAVGVGTTAARADHKHDISTAAATGLNANSTSTEGVATSIARSDHSHNIPTATAVGTSTSNGVGTSTSFSRADHIHNTVISNNRSASVSSITAPLTTDATMTGMSITPAAGTYLVWLESNITNTSGSTATTTLSIYLGASQQADSIRSFLKNKATGDDSSIVTTALVTVDGSTAITGQWHATVASAINSTGRSIMAIRVGS